MQKYDASSIQVLKGLEAVRKRPGMYIGDTSDGSGLHHMVYEAVDNAIDEALAGFCNKILVTLHKNGSVSIEDNGRGIPVDMHEEEQLPAAEVIMTQLHAGGKFSQDTYKVSGGLHGVGISVVNALSKWLILKIYRENKEYEMKFEKGNRVQELRKIGKTTKKGTSIHFLPDDTIFDNVVFSSKTLYTRFHELAFLNSGIEIHLKDLRQDSEKEQVIAESGGLKSFALFLAQHKKLIFSSPIYISGKSNDVSVDCSLLWTDSFYENPLYFTNTIPQKDGGTHAAGLRSALTRAFTAYIRDKGTKAQQKVQFTGEDIREGLVCVLSVKVADPKFSSQTKDKLVSDNVRHAVEKLVYDKISSWLEEHPTESNKVIQRIMNSAYAREAARKARDLSRKQKSGAENFQLAKKLAGCSEKDPAKCELFLVEGDSAGGSAKQARNRFTQAVLPLFGKILNVEKAHYNKVLSYEGITTLVASLGTGIGDNFDISKLRYHKVIIMTDADVDGKHILTLLLTFFFRYMKPLFEKEHIYIAQPPLYGVIQGKNITYLRDDTAFYDFILKRGLANVTLQTNNDEESDLFEYLMQVCDVDKILQRYSQIYRYSVVGKVFGQDSDLNIHSALMQYLQKMDGEWSVSEKDNTTVFIHQYRGVTTNHIFDYNQFDFDSYDKLKKFINNWSKMWGENVFWNENNVEDPFVFLRQVEAKGKKGLHIQRYKGLGEMNPEDLSKTAMRNYSKVTINNLQESDLICSDLMGDSVEGRREFISQNAQYAEVDV